ncbi:hypothetical protein ETH98_08570 [Macrococcoides caseolyticum]|uniref:hypothetical protein n=1 Tax=Macrococcoides caseolyticum TaxID=69966 RepID=UPI00105CBA79|nr:hypothetical protein [Macrococcus caseolyticus]TDM28776.1 hypothetical protein ETH98_08570 [Macrococcus caseolyticus]
MSNISYLHINGKEIQYTLNQQGTDFIIYNSANDRTIVGNQEVIEYIRNHPTIDNTSPLFDFVENKKKLKIWDFHIFSTTLNSQQIAGLSGFSKVTTNPIIVMISLVVSLYFLFFGFNIRFPESPTGIEYLKFLAILYPIQLVIAFFHEMSHFYYYNKNFRPQRVRFGLTLRYFSMLLFFTNVPFMNSLTYEKKQKLILAGIYTQITLMGVLSVLALTFQDISTNMYFIFIFIINLGSILTNLIPFLRLDGFWFISNFLKVDNYMHSYLNILKKKASFNLLIFIMGTLNIIFIVITILYSAYGIWIILQSI